MDGAKRYGVMLCPSGAKGHGAVLWVHFLDSFRQGSICKILTKRTKLQKLYLRLGGGGMTTCH
jgi:hypothetical protein